MIDVRCRLCPSDNCIVCLQWRYSFFWKKSIEERPLDRPRLVGLLANEKLKRIPVVSVWQLHSLFAVALARSLASHRWWRWFLILPARHRDERQRPLCAVPAAEAARRRRGTGPPAAVPGTRTGRLPAARSSPRLGRQVQRHVCKCPLSPSNLDLFVCFFFRWLVPCFTQSHCKLRISLLEILLRLFLTLTTITITRTYYSTNSCRVLMACSADGKSFFT